MNDEQMKTFKRDTELKIALHLKAIVDIASDDETMDTLLINVRELKTNKEVL